MGVLKNQIKDNFTQVPNELITDCRLSIQARMIYVYLASKPTGWTVRNDDVKQALGIKDNVAMARYWRELQEAKWLVRQKVTPTGNSNVGTYNYLLSESSKIEEMPNLGKTEIWGKTKFGKNRNLNNTKELSNTKEISNTDNKKNILKKDEQAEKLKERINTLFHRRASTVWSEKELAVLNKIASRKEAMEELTAIESLYNSGYKYRRRDIQTFLNNWTTEFDRAQNGAQDIDKPKRFSSQIGNPVWAPDERGRQPAPWDL